MEIKALYFSPTKSTEKIINHITNRFVELNPLENEVEILNFTKHCVRETISEISLEADQVLIIGVPVYAGRVPNFLLPFLGRINGNGAKAIAIVNYGNRHFDDALSELVEILKRAGFNIIAAAAFVSEHAFTNNIASKRPDTLDMSLCDEFARMAYIKACNPSPIVVSVPGNIPPGAYYKPLDINGLSYDFRKIQPETTSACIMCGTCAAECPMGSIDKVDYRNLRGICIKCCTCVNTCMVGAKQFLDTNFIKHKLELEQECIVRSEPTFYLE